ncbi:DnaJ domain-containing protein [Chloroflexota bacterium]
MKDYYQILGVPDNASQEDVRKAFRRLAFECHPDKNPGNEKQAEERFKEINEAYGVLGDKDKRRQYDLAGKGQFAGIGYDNWPRGFEYSQQDIFQDIFSNPAMFNELSRMFSQDGLRFDQDFLSRIFFESGGSVFQSSGGEVSYQSYSPAGVSARKPNWLERLAAKIAVKMGRFVLRKLFGFKYEPLPGLNLDHHIEFEVSPAEAASGGEKQVNYVRGRETKKLILKIPSGVKPGTKIRLKGMGLAGNNSCGDLYIHIKVRD